MRDGCTFTPMHDQMPENPRDALWRQQALVAMGRRAIAPPALAILLEDAATLIAEMLEAEYRMVATLPRVGGPFHAVLSRGFGTAASAQTFTHEVPSASSESLAGYALQVAHPVVVADLGAENRFADRWLWSSGVRSGVAVPLRLADRSFGALAACSASVRDFSADDVLFAETIAHLVTVTIARSEAESALAAERQFTAGVLENVAALVLVLDPQGLVRHANPACCRATGFSLAELINRPVWEALLAPEEGGLFKVILAKLAEGVSPVEWEGLMLTKHAQQRHVRWSYALLPGSEGQDGSILATGIDITEQREAEAQAAQGLPPPASAADEKTPASAGAGINRERRRRPRRSYPYRQLIAPILDGKQPPRSAFVQIECNDIAAGGFSFVSPQPPQSNQLVVALGVPPRLTYLSAEVAHVTRLKQDGKTMYQIGCTYTGRVQY